MLEVTINNRYVLESELGRGGMGVVYRAHDTLLDRDVAVKVLWSSALGSQGRARLLREARAAAQLNHPNIINIYDAGDAEVTAEGFSYIVMELLDGESLFERHPGSLDETVDILRQICDALEHAHTHGIIHRDLKPENVIVTNKGIAKLTDFGLSRSISARISQEGIIVGTVYYLAPEQALRQDIDHRADLYALGVMTYELVTGRLPFTADDPLGVISQHIYAQVVPPSTLNPSIPLALDALIVRLLSKRPEDRPASAAEVREALEHIYDADLDAVCDMPGLSPIDRLARGRLVGRQTEFAQVRVQWQNILNRTGNEDVLVISGEPGVGKTPLIKEMRSLAQISDGRSLLGECFAGASVPYSPIIQLLHEVQHFPEGLPDHILCDLHTLAPDLIEQPLPDNPPLSPFSEQQRLFESLDVFFSTLAERHPLMLIIEDAQWADGNTLLFIRHLAHRARLARTRILITLTYRPGELADNRVLHETLLELTQDRVSQTIDLQPFNREQTRELLAAMFMEDISDRFLDAIYKTTEGNLFFIEEICKALIEDGRLSCQGGSWHFTGIEELELPKSVRMALLVRVSRLPGPAQDLLRLAAVIGREFDFEILRRACEGQDEEGMIEAIELAERAQLIQEVRNHGKNGMHADGERYAFAHALIPATLREALSGLRRRRAHRRIAAAIEAVSADDQETLAYHYTQAGDSEKARFYTIRAGDHARKLYANAEALQFYNDALNLTPAEHPDRFRILDARAQVYEVLARREMQRADIDAMLLLAESFDDNRLRCDARIALANYYLLTEQLQAREPAFEAVTLARLLNDPVREGRALRAVGWGAWIRLDYHESLNALETAVTRFRQAGLLAQAAECLHMLSLVTGTQGLGELEISEKYNADALQLSRQVSDPRQEAISLRRLAIVRMDREEYDLALETAQQALAMHRRLGDRHEECMALNTIGVILTWLDRCEEARAYLEQSFEMATEINSSMGLWIAYSNLQWMYYRGEGEYEAGLVFTNDQLERPVVKNDPYLLIKLLISKAELLSGLGQYTMAREVIEEARQIGDAHASNAIRAQMNITLANVLIELGDYPGARFTLQEARQLVHHFERPNDLASLLLTEAEINRREASTGRLKLIPQAASLVDQALQLLNGTQWAKDQAKAYQIGTWTALAQNQFEKALVYSQAAVKVFDIDPAKPEGYHYVHALALWANGRDEEGNQRLKQAYQRVMHVASRIQDETLRRSWLESVQLNREIITEMQ